MNYLSIENNRLIYENNGETLQIEAWGDNSLRVRARMMGEILDTDYSLLQVKTTVNAKIQIEEDGSIATITNGKIRAENIIDGFDG